MIHRPWRVEYLDAESVWRVERTFESASHAEAALAVIETENPGVTYRIRKHVDFEAAT